MREREWRGWGDRQTDRHKDRQTDKQTDDRQTDKRTDRQKKLKKKCSGQDDAPKNLASPELTVFLCDIIVFILFKLCVII